MTTCSVGLILSEASVIAAIAQRDTHTFELVYKQYHQGVHALAVRLLDDALVAEEVVQETFLKLWSQPSSYQPQRGRLFPWLLGVARNHAIDLMRRRQLESRYRAAALLNAGGDGLVELLDSTGLASVEGDPQAHLEVLEQRLIVRSTLGALPVELRLPLELAYYLGMTRIEIAVRLGLSLSTVKTRMRRARKQLRVAPGVGELWSDR